MLRYRLRTLLIVLALGPPIIWWAGPGVRDAVLDAWRTMTGPAAKSISPDPAGRIIVDGSYYGLAKPGDRVLLKGTGRIYVNGSPRQPVEPWMPR